MKMKWEYGLAILAAAAIFAGAAGVLTGKDVQEDPAQESGAAADTWQEISREDYESVLRDLGYAEAEIEEELSAHADGERVEARALTREKHISGEFTLTGQATVFAWRDESGEMIQEIAAARVDSITLTGYGAEDRKKQTAIRQTKYLSGSIDERVAKGFCGSAEMTEVPDSQMPRLNLDYNGDYYFSVPQSAEVNFAEVVEVTDQGIVYCYEASGDFSWREAEIWQEEV